MAWLVTWFMGQDILMWARMRRGDSFTHPRERAKAGKLYTHVNDFLRMGLRQWRALAGL